MALTLMNDHVKGLECAKCGQFFTQDKVEFTCPSCGPEGIMDVIYDYEKIAKHWDRDMLASSRIQSLWRYKPLLPVDPDQPNPPLRVGGTPLYHPRELCKEWNIELWIKDDGINPTASLKDRASAVAVARAKAENRTKIVAASTGNAASSLTGAAASMGLESIIFVPERAPAAKVAQLLIFGANVFVVRGTYDTAFDLSMKVVAEYGFYNRNCAVNPYLVEGKKTAAYEFCEQLGWQVPDTVITSVGDGCIISSLYKGFFDLKSIGFIDHIPRLIAVQAEGSAAVKQLFETGEFHPSTGYTIADSIAVGVPRNRLKAVRALKRSNGKAITVTDDEILDAMRFLARHVGVFGEPAGVTSFAGLRKLVAMNEFQPLERVAVLMTGNGLKDIESAMKAAGTADKVDPDVEQVKAILEKRKLV